MRKVYFDKDYIYVAKFDKIHLSDILKIDERKIEFNDNGETRNIYFFFSSRRRHTRLTCDWSSDVCSSDLHADDMRVGKTAAVRCVKGPASIDSPEQD